MQAAKSATFAHSLLPCYLLEKVSSSTICNLFLYASFNLRGHTGETRKQKLISDEKTAADSPEIVVKQATESESDYTYTYVDEDEEEEDSGSLTDRPDSPVTAISEINIAGFRATAMIGSWLQRRKQRRPIIEEDEDDWATKIQAGYRGMITREQMKNKDNSKMIELR